MVPFSTTDLIGFAKDLEQNSQRFYWQAAGKVKSDSHGKLFLSLAEAEKGHFVILSGLHVEASTGGGLGVGTADHMAAMSHGPFLKHCVDFSGQLNSAKSDQQIFALATKLEHNAVDFYTALSNVLPACSAHATLSFLLQDEQSHQVSLEHRLATQSA